MSVSICRHGKILHEGEFCIKCAREITDRFMLPVCKPFKSEIDKLRQRASNYTMKEGN